MARSFLLHGSARFLAKQHAMASAPNSHRLDVRTLRSARCVGHPKSRHDDASFSPLVGAFPDRNDQPIELLALNHRVKRSDTVSSHGTILSNVEASPSKPSPLTASVDGDHFAASKDKDENGPRSARRFADSLNWTPEPGFCLAIH